MDNGHQAVTDNRRVDLNSDCVFGVSPELLDLQMLLYPLSIQLRLSILIRLNTRMIIQNTRLFVQADQFHKIQGILPIETIQQNINPR